MPHGLTVVSVPSISLSIFCGYISASQPPSLAGSSSLLHQHQAHLTAPSHHDPELQTTTRRFASPTDNIKSRICDGRETRADAAIYPPRL
jgi:hypothetical protein